MAELSTRPVLRALPDGTSTRGRPGLGRRLREWLGGPGLVVAIAAIGSAIAAVLLSVLLFPHLSIDNDEPIYRLQARALAGGHLFPPATAPTDSYPPWLSIARHGHYVLKYTPVVPAVHALSLALTGGFATGLALLAAAAVVATYALGVELLADRRVAALAAVLWAASPLVLVQSALLLPYLPFVLLLELLVLGVLRGLRRHSGWPLAGAGVALGLAGAARPYDTVLMLLPLACWLLWHERRRLGWALPRLLAGLALPVAALLAFDVAATGSALTLPFALLEPNDKLGFGKRQLYPSDPPHSFGLTQGLSGVGDHLGLLAMGWVAGGALLAVLAGWAVARGRVGRPAAMLGAGALVMCVGYLGFWGAWLAGELWGGISYVGPFYFMPLLVPLVLLGAVGLADLYRARVWAGVGAGAVAAAAVVGTLAIALPANATMTGHDNRLDALIAGQGRSLIFLPASPPFLQHPSAVLDNGLHPDGRTVFAVTRGASDFAAENAVGAGRQLLRMRILGHYNQRPDAPYVVQLERLRQVTAAGVDLRLTATPPPGAAAMRVLVTVGDRRLSWPISPQAVSRLTLRMTAAGPQLVGREPPLVETGPVPDPILKPEIESAGPGAVQVTLLGHAPGGPEVLVEADRLAYRTEATGTVTMLAPDGVLARQGRLDAPRLALTLAP